MEIKTHKIDFKNIDEHGCFEGYASVFNVVDHQKDIILPGSFNFENNVKMLWQHNCQKPIGSWISLKEDAYGLYVKGQLLMDLALAKEAYTLLKAGIIDGLSIGFVPVKTYYDQAKKARIVSKVDLVEISLVTFAANPKAKVTQIKNDQPFDWLSIKQKIDQLRNCFLNPLSPQIN